MKRTDRLAGFVALSALLLGLFGARAQAADVDPCTAFAFDVSHEHALFATTPARVSAGAGADSAPALRPEQLYRLTLLPQGKVTFAAAPEKKHGGEESSAGLARLHITRAGTYRIAANRPFWIDIVHEGKVVTSSGFSGSHECNAPRKVLQYSLDAGDYVLQVSGLESPDVDLTLTAAAAAAAAAPAR